MSKSTDRVSKQMEKVSKILADIRMASLVVMDAVMEIDNEDGRKQAVQALLSQAHKFIDIAGKVGKEHRIEFSLLGMTMRYPDRDNDDGARPTMIPTDMWNGSSCFGENDRLFSQDFARYEEVLHTDDNSVLVADGDYFRKRYEATGK